MSDPCYYALSQGGDCGGDCTWCDHPKKPDMMCLQFPKQECPMEPMFDYCIGCKAFTPSIDNKEVR